MICAVKLLGRSNADADRCAGETAPLMSGPTGKVSEWDVSRVLRAESVQDLFKPVSTIRPPRVAKAGSTEGRRCERGRST